MRFLAILLFAALPAAADTPDQTPDWDFICPEGNFCTIKKDALVELARAARRSCSFRSS